MKKNIFIAAFMVFIMNTLYAATLSENPFPAHPKANDGYINLLNTHTKSRMEQPAFESTDCDTIILKDGSVLAVEIRRTSPTEITFYNCDVSDKTMYSIRFVYISEVISKKYKLTKEQKKEQEKEPDIPPVVAAPVVQPKKDIKPPPEKLKDLAPKIYTPNYRRRKMNASRLKKMETGELNFYVIDSANLRTNAWALSKVEIGQTSLSARFDKVSETRAASLASIRTNAQRFENKKNVLVYIDSVTAKTYGDTLSTRLYFGNISKIVVFEPDPNKVVRIALIVVGLV